MQRPILLRNAYRLVNTIQNMFETVTLVIVKFGNGHRLPVVKSVETVPKCTNRQSSGWQVSGRVCKEVISQT